MSKNHEAPKSCAVCGKSFPVRELVAGGSIRNAISELIAKDHPEWQPDALICRSDLAFYRGQHVHSILASEKGELTLLEEQVVTSLREYEVLAKNTETEFEQKRTVGEKLADKLATFGGSWVFLSCFAAFMALWIGMNSLVLFWRPMDPYPFILLNLVLSCLASIQAPIIMMSQNRQEEKDRLRAQHDYQTNLKAELEIRQLHEKVDHLLSHLWERLVDIQEIQLEILAGLGHPR